MIRDVQYPITHGNVTKKSDTHWQVKSHKDKTREYHVIFTKDRKFRCTCPSWFFETSKEKTYGCKHIRNVYEFEQWLNKQNKVN